jgi:hypothetical protein
MSLSPVHRQSKGTKNMELIKKLNKIQKELKAPKNQFNAFGKYKYRNAEDILEAVKPLLEEVVLTITDDIVLIGERYYVKATAKITDGKDSVENSAFAREAQDKKGMDESQITGASSSYARKYALNGLFLIDDTKDADSLNTGSQVKNKPQEANEATVKIGFCSICGEQGVKSPKSGRYYCPNWKDENHKDKRWVLKQPDERTEADKEFLDNLPN